MRRLVREAERSAERFSCAPSYQGEGEGSADMDKVDVGGAAKRLSDDTGAAAIIAMSDDGLLARRLARHRPAVPVLCATSSWKVGRQLQLLRAVHPLHVPVGSQGMEGMVEETLSRATRAGLLLAGQTVVIVTGDADRAPTLTVRVV